MRVLSAVRSVWTPILLAFALALDGVAAGSAGAVAAGFAPPGAATSAGRVPIGSATPSERAPTAIPDTSETACGALAGRVLDRFTNRPLPGANVLVSGLGRGAATDEDGRFTIAHLPVGTHAVRVSMVGYETAVRAPVSVTTGRAHSLTVRLQPTVVEGEEVEVTADPFETHAEAPTSVRTLEAEEVRRAPGAAEDVQRAMQSMPGVAVANDRRNDLIVRGGSPRENLVVLDGIEVPNINHFGTQGATGGPISMLDTDFLSDVTFHTGGFPARYGGALSSVLDLELREGSRREFGGSLDLSMAGAGGSMEGPIPGGDGEAVGSWFLGVRRSYLDLLRSDIGLTYTPQYGSGQAKAVLDLSRDDRLTALGLVGRHEIRLETDAEEPEITPKNGGRQVVGGLSWRHLWGDAGSTTLTVSAVSTTFETDLAGENGALAYRNRSRETRYAVRLTSLWRLHSSATLDAGGTMRVIDYRHDLFRTPDTTNTGTPRPGLDETERAHPVRPDAYAQLTHRPTGRISWNAGLRVSAFSLTDHRYTLSPRLSARLTLVPSLHLYASWGRCVQRPELVWLTTTETAAALAPTRATHWIAGLEWTPGEAWRVTAEAYNKDYVRVPVYVDRPMLSTINRGSGYGAFTAGALSDAGTAHARGLELYAKRRLTDTFHALVSYTWSEARYTPLDGIERPTGYDTRHMATVIVGTSERDAGPLGLLGGSVKLRYASGQPITPFDRPASRALGRGIIDTDRVNAARLPGYLRLDVRVDRRTHFSWGTLTSYLEVQNATDHYNVADRVYDPSDHTVDDVTHWGRFLVGGVELEI